MSAQENIPAPEAPSGGAPVTAPEPAAAAAPPAVAAPAAKPEKETLRQTVERAVSTARVRDASGKFVAPESAAKFPTPENAAPARPPMPKSLKLELASHWDKTPTELAQAIIQREADYEKGVTPLKEKARLADAVLNEFKPYEMLLKMENTTPERAIGPLLQTAAIFRTGTPAQKAQAVAQIMRQYAVSPEHVQQVLSGQSPSQPAMDPQISQLTQQVAQLTQFQQSQNNARALTAIEQFSANPEHKYFDAVAPVMHDLIQNSVWFKEKAAGMTEADTLKLAYDTAIYANPDVRQQMQADAAAAQQAKEQARLQVEKAKNAALQVSGNPSLNPPPKADPANRRDTLARLLTAQ